MWSPVHQVGHDSSSHSPQRPPELVEETAKSAVSAGLNAVPREVQGTRLAVSSADREEEVSERAFWRKGKLRHEAK